MLGLLVGQQAPTPTPGVGPEQLVDYWPALLRAGWFLVGFAAVVLFGWYVVAPLLSRTVRRRNRDNPTIQDAVLRYFRVAVVSVAVFIGAGVAGYGAFLTSSALVVAAATLALGVAGQAVIGSLISGLVLVFDPEFNVGNYVEWGDGEGEIVAITLRVTRIRSPDGKLVTVPNTVLTGQAIARPYDRQRHRVVERIGLAYEADAEAAIEHLEAAATDIEGILGEPAPSAYVDTLGEEVVVRVHYWVANPRGRDVLELRSRYVRAVKDRLEAADIVISPASKRELQGRIEVADPG